jgi:hypothetical protein
MMYAPGQGRGREVSSYTQWRARANAELDGPDLMLERHWRRLFILGRQPSEAAQEAEALLHNARVRKLERRR